MTATRPTIQQAVRALASQCDGARDQDGVGFNGRDTDFGRSLAQLPDASWTIRRLEAAHKMLRTYARQLSGLGIRYEDLTPPSVEIERIKGLTTSVAQRAAGRAEDARERPDVTIDGTSARSGAHPHKRLYQDPAKAGRFLLEFPYDKGFVGALQAKGLKCFKDVGGFRWIVPHERAAELLPVLEAAGFAGLDLARALTRTRAETAEASRAVAGAPSVVMPNGKPLRPFQATAVAYARKQRRVLIADDMGLGKTLEAIATIETEKAYPALIVPPASLKLNWVAEFEKWGVRRRIEVLDTKKDVPSGKADVYVVNYDLLEIETPKCSDGKKHKYKAGACLKCFEPKQQKKRGAPDKLVGLAVLLQQLRLQAIAFDEGHYLKEPTSLRSRAAKLLAAGVSLRLILTGTPIKNRPVELAHQLDVLGRLGEFGGFMAFAKRYCNAHQGSFGWDFKGASNLEELHQRLRETCYVRRTKAEVLPELPPKIRQRVLLPLSNAAEYRAAERDFLDWLVRNRGDEAANRAMKAETLTRIGVLRQVAARGKIEPVKVWLEAFRDAQAKICVFAHHIEVQNELARAFDAPQIAGGRSALETEAAKKRFIDGPDDVIVCSILAGGVGHTLHADGRCSSVAFHELGWSPSDMEQGISRVDRMGQTAECVNIYFLVAKGTIDEEMEKLLEAKQVIVDAATDGKTRETLAAQSVEDDLIDTFVAKARSKNGGRS